MTDSQSDFQLTISLNVLEHLGINLYSNVAAVLSETVANAWDADASTVHVDWDKEDGTIVIHDNGIGMTPKDIDRRFLTVGYRRRVEQPGATSKNRRPMGRKGIGKLSLFSVANVVDVETAKDGETSAFRLDVTAIRETIRQVEGDGTYRPERLPEDNIDFQAGTRITLRQLRRKRVGRTLTALKRRLARRFSIIGAKHDFRVFVNGDEVTPADRDYYDKIRYIWTYGDQDDIRDLCTKVDQPYDRTRDVEHGGIGITGWLATVGRVGDLKEVGASGDDGDNLNRIAVFVRGKMAQEDVLVDFPEPGLYASYLLGELHVDDFDQYDGAGKEDDDAATSSRQRIVEDDPRYRTLRTIIRKELKHIQQRWKELRSDEGTKKALRIPEVKDWLDQLPSKDSTKAREWLGRLNRIRIDSVEEQKNLIKHAVLAFEFYRSNEDLRRLKDVSDKQLEVVLEIFENLDDVENNMYGQITRQRISVIRTLQEKVDRNSWERVIQEYLFNHLWLLDPSWERAESTEIMEKRVTKLFNDVDAGLTNDEKQARIDIAYRKTAGQHVIVELKRPERRIRTSQIISQLEKYKSGMTKLLTKFGSPREPVEFVVLLGQEPPEWNTDDGQQRSKDLLATYNARIVYYDGLLEEAQKIYADYWKKHQATTYLAGVIRGIEDYAPSPSVHG